MATKKLSFEEAMARLEEIVTAMEQGEAPLEQSLALFTEGTTLLDKAEQQVTRLTRGADGQPVEAPFEGER